MLPGCYQEKPSVAAGFRVWRPAAWIRDCICGKQVVDGLRLDRGHTLLLGAHILKSSTCDMTTGTGGNFAGWSDETSVRHGLGRQSAN